MKLISMTDFVLEQSKLTGYDISDYDWIIRIVNYAQFIKQPLKLEMFVPCDEDGNVLQDPGLIPSFELEQYRKAKEKVLFKNAYIDNYNRLFCGSYVFEIIKNKIFCSKKTIEDLIDGRNIELTQNATKQFL